MEVFTVKNLSKLVKCVGVAALAVLTLATFSPAVEAADVASGLVTADGFGAMPDGTPAPRARLLARRAAVVDAYRNLVTEVNGVQVDATTTVENSVASSDVVRTRVSGLIKGARVVSEDFVDGVYRVTVSLPIFGEQSVAAAVLPANPTPAPFASPALFAPTTSSAGQSTTVTPTTGNFTGVVVDCRGLGLSPVMSPVIKSANGQPVYGYKNLDSKFVVKNGMAAYGGVPEDSTRAGARPLMIKAVSVDNGVNPVISDADAARLLSENQLTHFLDQTNVVFLK